jgi:hypothetical protein
VKEDVFYIGHLGVSTPSALESLFPELKLIMNCKRDAARFDTAESRELRQSLWNSATTTDRFE